MDLANKVLVNQHEKRILDYMNDGMWHKMRDISDKTGYNYTTVNNYLKMFRELGWVNYNEKTNIYKVKADFEYYTNESKKDEKVMKRSPLEATYRHRTYEQIHSGVTVTKWTPEQIAEHEKKATSHHKFIEYKKGVFVKNENYRHAEDSR